MKYGSYVCQLYDSNLGPPYQESVRAEPSWPAERILAKILAAELAAEFGSFSILGMLIDSLKTEQEFSPCVIKSSFNPANSDCKS